MTDRILVLGGYGVFGGKLSAYLAQTTGCEVLVAGRSMAAATRFCAAQGGTPVEMDRTAPSLARDIAALAPKVVVDAAGPFQAYGTDPYALARAAIACGAHYIDLCDDAAFAAGITLLDPEARAAGVAVISGASSVPGLSAAVVTQLATGLRDIQRIESSILPGNRAPRGLSVMRAILAQAGQPVAITRAGHPDHVIGWSGSRRQSLALPGTAPLQRSAAYIGAPDLALFPAHFKARTVLFRAGLELPLLHHGLGLLSLLVRAGFIRSLEPLAPLLRRVAQGFEPFGSDRGGMSVRLVGTTEADGQEERIWTLIAEAGDGPHIPSLPARALCLRALRGALGPGARPCLSELDLAEILHTAEGLKIATGSQTKEISSIFQSALGPIWAELPAPIQALHESVDSAVWQGEASVTTGKTLAARLIRRLIGFPKASPAVPVRVTIHRDGAQEVWTRTFGTKRFHSVLKGFGTPGAATVTERFGPLRFVIALNLTKGCLAYPVTRGWAFGLPLPRVMLPKSETVEEVVQGRFHFDVAVSMPLIGLIVRYKGWLTPA